MLIRTVIIDDEKPIVNGLAKLLKHHCPQVKIVATATNSREAKEILRSKAVDLVFLDIKLGNVNSFHLLDKLQPIEFQVIFITAYDKYAIDAFKYSAVDYLMKPIDPDDLIRSVNKVEKSFYMENLQLKLKSLLYNQQNTGNTQTIILRTFESYHVVHISDIVQCEAQGNYTLFHLKDDSRILVSQTLKKYDLLLSKFNFFRCHQSHLVNMDTIVRFDRRDGGTLVLKNQQQIPVSTRRKEQLFEILSL